ncbi:MAG: DUF4827 domain-containing protein [Prevotella sp.]|uniref:DUF4827 domain-containing protein n=1 Tax=Prevotella sp. TaxID=59823 RepID=UPI002A280EE2|nr:DUF4827 domain-containing protein [Prevotella sp.]MDD7317603.1 DUF4827 domain-containing protein [Prevotellaceae bacterium]MDY4020550.1 DUF4827 domain-containing protein [Prevotella sp.]
MKKTLFTLLAVVTLMMTASCNKIETYAEQMEKENDAIKLFIRENKIKVISENVFEQQGFTTDVASNEYVLFNSSGVYMQIVRKGCGELIQNGERATILCRFTEKNILTDSIMLDNRIYHQFSSILDKMVVTNTSGTFTASFDMNSSLMYHAYGSASVPSGWLAPLPYIKIGRQSDKEEEIAQVNLIVPHSQGQSYATAGVYPCFYTITYERGM